VAFGTSEDVNYHSGLRGTHLGEWHTLTPREGCGTLCDFQRVYLPEQVRSSFLNSLFFDHMLSSTSKGESFHVRK